MSDGQGLDVVAEVAVGKDNALGHPRGAAGEEDGSRVAGCDVDRMSVSSVRQIGNIQDSDGGRKS